MRHLIYCVMCLGKEVKMYHMNSTMTKIYNEFISTSNYRKLKLEENTHSVKNLWHGLELCLSVCFSFSHICMQKSNVTPKYACYECAYLLYKYDEFKRKCCKAYNILCILDSEPIEVTEKCLSSIDRKQNGLMTKLTSYTFTNDYQPKEQACESYEDLNSDNDKYDNIPSENKITYNDDNLLDMERLQPDIKSAPQDNIEEDYTHMDFVSGPEHDIETDQVPLDFKSTREHDIENDYQFTHTYQVESTNYETDAGSMLWLTIQSKENTTVGDIKPDLGTPTELHQECFDTANDYNILDKFLVIDGTKAEKGAVKIEIKCDTAKGSETNKTLETVNDEEYKQITNKESQNNENRSSDGSDMEDCNSLLNDTPLESNLLTRQVTVTALTPEEARREFLVRMKTNNYVNSPYTCDLCYRGFLTELSHESHLKRHTLVHGEFECHICKLRYPTANYRNQHVVRVHNRRFSCNICSYVCYNLTQCKAHMQSHEGKKYTCKICEIPFGYRNSLLTHMRLKHSVECACEFCGSTFASAKGLFSHKSLVHRGEKNEQLGPKCDECNVHFGSEVAWKRHRVLSSRHEVKFGCKVCGDVFQDQSHQRKHSRVHGTRDLTRKPYWVKTCLFCKVTLPNKSDLRKHLLSEHPTEITGNLNKFVSKNYVCEFCGKTFANRFFLAAHHKKHSDETPYSCPECGWKTKNKSRLKAHLRIHTSEDNKFECDLCGGSFSEKGGLVKHMKGHMGIRPFKCVACDKSFMFRCDERTHYKHVHDNVPYPKRNDDPKKRRRKKGPHARIKIFDNI